MIINASGRTDIVGFYTPWFLNRIKEGYFLVQNPFDAHFLSRIEMKDIDLIVFCTKNPLPILGSLDQIPVPYLFQVTLTPYHQDVEPNVANKKEIIKGIQALSLCSKIKPVLRYDPILVNSRYTVDYHVRAFSKLCKELDGYVEKIIVSFVDVYKNVRFHQQELQCRSIGSEDMEKIGLSFAQLAAKHHMSVQTCFEKQDLSEYGFKKDVCLSVQEAYAITGKIFKKWKARNCGCVEMVDIGAYNTCQHLCKYCYANYDERQIQRNIDRHDPLSPLLIGHPRVGDVIKERL